MTVQGTAEEHCWAEHITNTQWLLTELFLSERRTVVKKIALRYHKFILHYYCYYYPLLLAIQSNKWLQVIVQENPAFCFQPGKFSQTQKTWNFYSRMEDIQPEWKFLNVSSKITIQISLVKRTQQHLLLFNSFSQFLHHQHSR